MIGLILRIAAGIGPWAEQTRNVDFGAVLQGEKLIVFFFGLAAGFSPWA